MTIKLSGEDDWFIRCMKIQRVLRAQDGESFLVHKLAGQGHIPYKTWTLSLAGDFHDEADDERPVSLVNTVTAPVEFLSESWYL